MDCDEITHHAGIPSKPVAVGLSVSSSLKMSISVVKHLRPVSLTFGLGVTVVMQHSLKWQHNICQGVSICVCVCRDVLQR